jgi:hypothetical protein
LTAGADVLALAPLCDETILVVREGTTTRDARRARDALGAASACVRGIILERGGRAQRRPADRQRRPAWQISPPFARRPDVEPPTPRVAAKA